MIKKFWTYRRNILISFVLIGIIVLPEAKYFHEWALAGIVGALLVSTVGAVKAESTIEKKTTLFDGLLIFLTSLICTAVFWYRAWNNLPSDFLIEPIFDLITGFGFWWPGIFYASLYRHPDETWPPSSRARYLQNLGIGVGGSLTGIVLVYALL
ncbi:hypothetical protein [Rhodohalobacter sp.]|uniref:hypothetical protein n=1 Tax=Rhodohalobacter sp. TaxID=1974210 RepID=UPI002ACE608F|nr:hypothetical protein [Rhodohalobacter sp.]MDZ7755403.1 hypothetical protein [Rhodohalobacter sp.]